MKPYLQLLRLPNVFTALADVAMGYLLTHAGAGQGVSWYRIEFGLLLVASGTLYLAGMVLNDVFDYDTDCRERPERPLPSGRVTMPAAKFLGWQLLATGLLCGWLAGAAEGEFLWRPGLVATALVAAILVYDGGLKRTPLGPLGMGACRLLNVLLGMSLLPGPWQPMHYLIAGALGLYIVGVTWLARTEAETSQRAPLLAATVVMSAGLALLAWTTHDELHAARLGDWWFVMWAALGASIVYRAVWAVMEPEPWRVQRTVKHAILSIIILDGFVALAACGNPAIGIVLLSLPAVWLGRWIYST